ncbi:hypothetical protein NEOLEDRAFT_1141271 [Neolentinus lepideus HHB14362 ss-1]|uniref:Uncharacterized protein n=1 Tax=Neolentinus lepideus HHB14362 ss-1 TaxID=1314782 RepID=A0A165NQQ9_9AGAM|nr:hypothetical protein NEOLEDRAFT_1141271 [Neolentinus lepideus HHB14362 ss-1]
MTPRPSFKHKRPLSAIFLGASPSSSFSASIPDLPEPPSPGGSSGSGLPSPPATNSTGSGSAGDNGSIRLRSSASSSSNTDTNMINGNKEASTSRARNVDTGEDEEGGGFEEEGDDTARLSRAHHRRPSENELALLRVKSLTQRNRMAIDKLSRLSTPSPSHAGRTGSSSGRSPLPPNSATTTSSSASTSSHRLSAHSKSYSNPQTRASHGLESGSETEREGHSLRSYPSSDDLSVTPPSTFSGSSQTRSNSARARRTSVPASPVKENLALSSSSRPNARNASPGPSRTPRKRVSIASSFASSAGDYDDEREDVASAALAAIGASRRSPTIGNSRRARQPLPREFRDTFTSRKSLDGKSLPPSTPHRTRDRNSFLEARGSPSPTSAGSTLNLNSIQQSPRPPRASAGRSVRELSRRHQSRWMSEDITSTSVLADPNDGEESDLNAAISPSGLIYGKRQSLRGGSAESALGGRSLVSEGLKAAGIGAKRGGSGMDLFRDEGLDREKLTSLARARTTGSSSRTFTLGNVRASEGAGPLAKTRNSLDLRTTTPAAEPRVTHRMSMSSRPSTSMADCSDENPPQTAPPTSRTYRTSLILPERERERFATEVPLGSRQQSLISASQDRMYSSPLLASRRTPSALAGQLTQQNAEHARLMLESLSMFESSLSRLPPMGTTTTSTIPDLFRSAQTIVHSAEKLNTLLRSGTANALERQIDADVADEDIEEGGVRLSELWRSVGGDFRESMRVSDELIRTLTGFLLGVGKVLRDSASTANAGLQHLRTGSLDEEAGSRGMTPDVGARIGRRISDGRTSADTRRSWEAAPRDSARQPPSRAGSSLRRGRDSEEGTERDYADLISPEDNLPDPSPTPAARHQSRSLRPLTIPPALSTVPSESIIQRQASSTSDGSRRKISSNSNATVRAGPMPSTLKTPGAITAVTPHTVSNSPEKSAFSLPRTDSSNSSGSRAGVTFSRSATVSVSTLTGVQERARKRTISATSSTADEALEAIAAADAETRRRTIGARGRVPLDSVVSSDSSGAKGGSQNPTLPSGKKERRRTITEIFGPR